ncbi:MAG: hypothetical protein IT582_00310 [Opitutaceae bacterium]|nr:hypothetical protein [Opitutaceae bacterium]
MQRPRSSSARWNLALAYDKAGYTPNAIAPLLKSSPLADVARLASPADWDRWLIVGASLAAFAVLTLLLRAYRLAPAWTTWLALVVLLLGVLTIGAAATGHHAYGVAANPRAALVWRAGTLYSIPTEADTAQQTTTLAAGAMGVMDKTFLGWTRLSFPNGQTGWVRQSEIVPLWYPSQNSMRPALEK